MSIHMYFQTIDEIVEAVVFWSTYLESTLSVAWELVMDLNFYRNSNDVLYTFQEI